MNRNPAEFAGSAETIVWYNSVNTDQIYNTWIQRAAQRTEEKFKILLEPALKARQQYLWGKTNSR